MDKGAAGQRLRNDGALSRTDAGLSRDYSSYFAPYNHVADPHIDDADEGMTAALIGTLFDELKRQLVPMVRAICEQPAARMTQSLTANFPQSSPVRVCPACCGMSRLRI